MRTPRIYTAQPLQPATEVELPATASRHLLQVLRLRPGAHLALFNGDGYDYLALLTHCSRNSARIRVNERSEQEPLPTLSIHLGIGISRGERMDYAIQKSVELGVSSIAPLLTERCVVRLSAERLQRRTLHWQGVVTAACEQSGRRRLPELIPPQPLEQWIAAEKQGGGARLLLDHRSQLNLQQLPQPRVTLDLLIGPEGGLSGDERRRAQENGFTAIRLGPRVLRTETAPLAAIAAIQTLWGDLC